MREALSETLALMHSLDASQTLDDALRRIVSYSSKWGYTNVLSGLIPEDGEPGRRQISNLFFAEWPVEWMHRYFARGYVYSDPTITRIKSSQAPFSWRTLRAEQRGDSSVRIMDEAAEFRLSDGLTVPLATLDGRMAGFSFAGERVDDDPSTIGALTLIASYATALAIKRRGEIDVPVFLSPRERDVLRWTAEGKSEWDISVILGISQATVDKYMRRLRDKLSVANKTHLVAKAFRLRLIA